MKIAVTKKTFSIKNEVASKLDKYSDKSKFVNKALIFYIDYLNNINKYKTDFLENKIKEALEWEFYDINLTWDDNINKIKYIDHSSKLENELLLAINGE